MYYLRFPFELVRFYMLINCVFFCDACSFFFGVLVTLILEVFRIDIGSVWTSQPLFLGDPEEGEQELQTTILMGKSPHYLVFFMKACQGLERKEIRLPEPYIEHG